MKLTRTQKETLEWIKAFIADHGMPPTVREIGRAFGIQSSSVFQRLQALEKKGVLKRGKLGARSLDITDSVGKSLCTCWSIPLLGRIAAGRPILAVENIEDRLAVDPRLGGEEMFALKVAGDSMVEDGILDGDVVIVRQQQTAVDGDIVVALVDEEATVKRFYRQGRQKIRLEPANKEMEPMVYPEESVLIQGKVVAVQRMLD